MREGSFLTATTPKVRLLVALEDARFRAEVCKILEALGFIHVAVKSRVEAIEALQSDSSVNVLILDTAIELAEEIQTSKSARAMEGRVSPLGVILLAAVPDEDWLSDAISEGPSEILLIPPASEEFEAALDRMELAFAQASVSVEDLQDQVQIISKVLIRIGKRLSRIARTNEPAFLDTDPPVALQELSLDRTSLIVSVRRLIRARRMREKFFHHARFGEPAWDILLDLTLAWLEDKTVSASSVAIASGVPMSTAMRWVNEMAVAGLIDRKVDPDDGRRHFVEISAASRSAMLDYLAALNRADQTVERLVRP